MHLMKKNLLMPLILSTFSISIHAGTMGPIEEDIKLFIPHLKPGIGAYASALWLKPGANNLNYIIDNKGLPIQTPSWTEKQINTSFSPGFEVGLNYVFPQATGNDVNLSWARVNTNNSNSIDRTKQSQYFLGPDYEIGPNDASARTASGNAQFKYNVVNLDFGQYVNFGQPLQMRFFGGVSGAFLEEDVTSTLTGTTFLGLHQGPFSHSQTVTSTFDGVGPRIGIHANYRTHYGIGLLGEGAVSALIGSLRTESTYLTSSQQLLDLFNQTSNNQFIKNEAVYQVTPGINGKLGLDYHYLFTNGGLLSVEAGYRAEVYMNAISEYIPASLVSSTSLESGGIYVATMTQRLSNYSMQGPFVTLGLKC